MDGLSTLLLSPATPQTRGHQTKERQTWNEHAYLYDKDDDAAAQEGDETITITGSSYGCHTGDLVAASTFLRVKAAMPTQQRPPTGTWAITNTASTLRAVPFQGSRQERADWLAVVLTAPIVIGQTEAKIRIGSDISARKGCASASAPCTNCSHSATTAQTRAPMHLLRALLALPPSLLFLSSHATSAHAHNNGAALPPPAHLPEPRLIQKREAIAARIGAGTKPVAVRKMTEDEGEMFFNEYWGFEAREEEGAAGAAVGDGDVLRREYQDEEDIARTNPSTVFSFRPAFAIHEASSPALSEAQARHQRSSRALAALLKRAFQCPTGTSACTSISQPNYCCATSESCVSITDTGLGPVGCCPAGQSCGGEITHYAAYADYDFAPYYYDDAVDYALGDDDGGTRAAGSWDW
ncbi:hypothetical protein V500_10445 [Pseudogymnoascus sp. VKM F-4518 (FW-2643)]|nr:hypothetical protein V500_10445 [Pseudogymnoascus sp. VKM F-4518 (FW-2643)]